MFYVSDDELVLMGESLLDVGKATLSGDDLHKLVGEVESIDPNYHLEYFDEGEALAFGGLTRRGRFESFGGDIVAALYELG